MKYVHPKSRNKIKSVCRNLKENAIFPWLFVNFSFVSSGDKWKMVKLVYPWLENRTKKSDDTFDIPTFVIYFLCFLSRNHLLTLQFSCLICGTEFSAHHTTGKAYWIDIWELKPSNIDTTISRTCGAALLYKKCLTEIRSSHFL